MRRPHVSRSQHPRTEKGGPKTFNESLGVPGPSLDSVFTPLEYHKGVLLQIVSVPTPVTSLGVDTVTNHLGATVPKGILGTGHSRGYTVRSEPLDARGLRLRTVYTSPT